MSLLKVAILEDNKMLLKELKENLEESQLVEVLVFATNSEEFLEKVAKSKIEALILDIDLIGDSMNGIDIASKLQLPVLFVSGKTKDFFLNIEDLNLNSDSIIVEHVSKPITTEKLNKILPKFINRIHSNNKAQFTYLDFGERRKNKIALSSIVFLESDKKYGAESNNKRIYFKDKPTESLIDFSFVKMKDIGFAKTQFIQSHRSYRVNKDYIESYNSLKHEIFVTALNEAGKKELFKIPVSANYRKAILNL
jgi:DNA-binding LytR/AlgR family response regulator